jgi:hypothetical protein
MSPLSASLPCAGSGSLVLDFASHCQGASSFFVVPAHACDLLAAAEAGDQRSDICDRMFHRSAEVCSHARNASVKARSPGVPFSSTRMARRLHRDVEPGAFLEQLQIALANGEALSGYMAALIYRCPATGQNVQTWFADDGSENGNTYLTVTCLACQQVHLVNPGSGKVLGNDDE